MQYIVCCAVQVIAVYSIFSEAKRSPSPANAFFLFFPEFDVLSYLFEARRNCVTPVGNRHWHLGGDFYEGARYCMAMGCVSCEMCFFSARKFPSIPLETRPSSLSILLGCNQNVFG